MSDTLKNLIWQMFNDPKEETVVFRMSEKQKTAMDGIVESDPEFKDRSDFIRRALVSYTSQYITDILQS